MMTCSRVAHVRSHVWTLALPVGCTAGVPTALAPSFISSFDEDTTQALLAVLRTERDRQQIPALLLHLESLDGRVLRAAVGTRGLGDPRPAQLSDCVRHHRAAPLPQRGGSRCPRRGVARGRNPVPVAVVRACRSPREDLVAAPLRAGRAVPVLERQLHRPRHRARGGESRAHPRPPGRAHHRSRGAQPDGAPAGMARPPIASSRRTTGTSCSSDTRCGRATPRSRRWPGRRGPSPRRSRQRHPQCLCVDADAERGEEQHQCRQRQGGDGRLRQAFVDVGQPAPPTRRERKAHLTAPGGFSQFRSCDHRELASGPPR